MANTYFVSSLTDTQIESVLDGLYRLQTQENNGKTVGIVNGVLGVITGGGGGISGVYKGTFAPSPNQGNNGDIYIQNVELPNDVTFVEYIEASGTQYIDTEIVADQDTQAYCDLTTISQVLSGAIFGVASSTGTSGRYFSIKQRANDSLLRAYYGSNVVGLSTLAADTNYKLIFGKVIFNENGIANVFYGVPETFSTLKSLYIFAENVRGSITSISSGFKLQRLTLRQSGVIIADFLPALDSDNTPCLYEAVSGEYKYNAGTGSFSYGTNSSPIEACTVYQKDNGQWKVITQTATA